MVFPNDILDNREIAIIIWLGVVFVWAIFQKSIRKSLVAIFKAFTQKVIFVSTILMLIYIGAVIYLFYRINFWELSNLSDTAIWILGTAFVMFININRTKEDDYFRKAVVDNVKFVVFIEFVTNLYVFNLWAELILVPVMAVIGGMMGVASTNQKYKQVESCLTKIVGIIGIGFIIYALYHAVVDFKEFASLENLREFLLPLLLTVTFLPFVYIMAIYVTYDLIFMRIKHLIKNSALARYAKWKTVFAFHLNLRALNKWLKKIVRLKFDSKEEIKQATMSVKASGA